MNARRGTLLVLSAVLCSACLPAGAAGAAGLPIPSWHSGKTGAVAPGGSERLTARRAGENTIVSALRRGDRRVLRSREIEGRWTIPGNCTGTFLMIRSSQTETARSRKVMADA